MNREQITTLDKRALICFATYSFLAVSVFGYPLAFLPLYFRDLQYTPFQIACLSTSSTIATIVGAPFALQLTHLTIAPRKYVLTANSMAIVCFFLLLFAARFEVMLVLLFLGLFAKHSADAIVDSTLVGASHTGKLRFEHVRVWGSIGFAVSSFSVGTAIDWRGTGVVPHMALFNVVLVLAAGLLVASYLGVVPSRARVEHGELHRPQAGLQKIDLSFLLLVASAFFVWASHGPMNVYLSIYLEQLGWSGGEISTAWNIGVGAEILLFLFFPYFQRHFSLINIFRLSIALTVIRWTIVGLTSSPNLILISQVLHAFSFGGCYLASIKLVYLLLPPRYKERGYGYYIALGPGTGSVMGRIAAGYSASFLASYADLGVLFLGGSLTALAALGAAFFIKLPSDPHPAAVPPNA